MRRRDFFSTGAGCIAVNLAVGRANAEESAAEPKAPRNTLVLDRKCIVEERREVPITHEADVVVVGATVGGLGGCMAAVAAARQGAKTLLIESAGHIDLHVPIGLGIVIGIQGWLPTIREGLFRELAERVARAGEYSYQPLSTEEVLEKGELIVRHHDVVTTAILGMLVDAGVQLLFHTRLADAVVEEGVIKAVMVESPQGRHAIAGKAFVDSTGLGDLAALAGAPMRREEGFLGLQAFIGHVDEQRYRRWSADNDQPLDKSYRGWIEKEVGSFNELRYPWDQWWPEFLGDRYPRAVVRKAREAHAKGEFTLLRRRGKDGVMAIPEGIKANGEVAMPRTYITGIDPTNIDDLNWAEVHSRFAVLEFYRFLKNYVPGFEQCVLERVADAISMRGGRYIETDKNITKEALAAGEKHADCIYLFRRGIDKKTFEVPLSALTPKQVENLLVVGKATSGGVHLRTAHGVLFQGQAAGIAAALSAAKGTSVSQTDIKALQRILKEAGVGIPY